MCALIELVLPIGFYSSHLHGVTIELRLLSDLLGRSHGSLLSHLQRVGISVEMACSKWMMCVFVTVLPLNSALRIWDLMLLDSATKSGPTAVPLVGCLGLLQMHEAQLLATQEADALLPALISLPSHIEPTHQDILVESVSKFVSSAFGTDLLQAC